jgi:hypothetical protein
MGAGVIRIKTGALEALRSGKPSGKYVDSLP